MDDCEEPHLANCYVTLLLHCIPKLRNDRKVTLLYDTVNLTFYLERCKTKLTCVDFVILPPASVSKGLMNRRSFVDDHQGEMLRLAGRVAGCVPRRTRRLDKEELSSVPQFSWIVEAPCCVRISMQKEWRS